MPRILSVELADPGLLGEIAPWDLDFRPLEGGRATTDVLLYRGRALAMMDFSSAQKTHQVGAAPADTVTLGIPVSRQGFRWKDDIVGAGHLLSFGSGEAFDGITPAAFRGLTYSIPVTVIDRLSRSLGVDLPDAKRAFGLVSRPSRAGRLAGIAARTRDALKGADPQFAQELEDEIVGALLLAMTDGDSVHDDRSRPATRALARRRALAAMDELAADAVLISDICAASGVSWRTLDRAFKEAFGIGPKRYFLNLRLKRARGEILFGSRGEPISSVANRWGFWHMGKFASDYRRLFGELPSGTRATA